MNYQAAINTAFKGKAFSRPLFYNYPGGLRFEMSEGGSGLEMVLQAIGKATPICSDVFEDSDTISVCLQSFVRGSRFGYRKCLRELREAGIFPPKVRELWIEIPPQEDWSDENIEDKWVFLAFELQKSKLQALLWCAFTKDFPNLQPYPGCTVLMFDFARRIAILPYDDRGMDMVGEDHALLSTLYHKYSQVLLDYDRQTMMATFERTVLQDGT